ncbi:alkylhydroperoxidase [Actinophytocola xinjiangensis]|uniref:Alkylhydroperoxidase n=1 Tax=Actinophytocola xinjiangensis TaxID=485602 RepID=A0A7Z0WR61_9PSEU|nr:carboxymuconolactone decarboxylase family protein [Actinophytocola xinjiangensis]OLF12941.1 alkylhydroperoxidase [Actinophytocola xinjiangensis]
MIRPLVRFAVRRSLTHDTRYVEVVRPRRARGLVAEVYRQVEDEFGTLAPPTAMHSVAPDTLAASWMILRETLVAKGVAPRPAKEAVATGVSLANSCPYCADVHGMTLDAIPDVGPTDELVAWARGSATAAGVVAPPFPASQLPELVGVAVAFQYYNRVVNVFLRDSPFPAHVPESAKPKARKVLGRALRPPADGGPPPGGSLDLLPAVARPSDLAWAGENEAIAGAFGRAYAAVDNAGARSVPRSVRELVADRLSSWDGQAPGLSRAWVQDAVAGLAPADQPAGRLALVVAMSSYQVDEGLVEAFRATAPGDEVLMELVSWASLAAARRISSWVGAASPAAAE